MNRLHNLLFAGVVLLSACSDRPGQPQQAKTDRYMEQLTKLAETPEGWAFIRQAQRECESLATVRPGGSHPSKYCRAVNKFISEHTRVL